MERLLQIMAALRSPGGCPWDREQTPVTLKPQLLEECYEVLEAIDESHPAHLKEELGDLLLHIIFQAQIATEQNQFTFAEVAEALADKLVRRHPHVFAGEKVADSASTITLWNQLKKKEKPERESALDGVPRALPALLRAEALQKKARNVGFDWPDPHGALLKVREELTEVTDELEQALKAHPAGATFSPSEEAAEELGDLLFAVVNLTRQLKLHAEELLTGANEKFFRRFRAVEKLLASQGKALTDSSLAEMEAAWEQVKVQER